MDATSTAGARPSRDGRRGPLRNLLRLGRVLLFPAIVLAVFFGILPRIANLDDVWREIRALSWEEDSVLGLLTVLNIVTYWPMLVAAMPGLSLPQAAVVCQSSTAVAMTVPAGGAVAVGVSYAMYTSWGFTGAEVARSAMATFFANMGFKLLLPAVALALLVLEGDANGGLLATAVLGLGSFVVCASALALLLRDERVARWSGGAAGRLVSMLRRLVRRPPVRDWAGKAAGFRAQMVSLLRDRGLPLVAAEILSQLSVFAVLFAAVRFVGIPNHEVTFAETLAVFAFVRLASAVPIIPGNVGLAELGYIGGLDFAGAHDAPAVAAVLVFRFLTYLLQIPLGGVTYLIWRRKAGWRVPPRAPLAEHQDPPDPARAVRHGEDGERGRGHVEQADHREQERPGIASS
ncbi:MAG: YbhN family protein [Actinomycetota bacterium]